MSLPTRSEKPTQPNMLKWKIITISTIFGSILLILRSDLTLMAEEVLEQMIHLSASGALTDAAPDTKTFSTMILCYAISETCNNPTRADELFHQLLDLHAKGKIKDAPNKKTYVNLRQAWSRSSARNKAQRISEIDSAINEKFHSLSSNVI
jgi:hypothetical protein